MVAGGGYYGGKAGSSAGYGQGAGKGEGGTGYIGTLLSAKIVANNNSNNGRAKITFIGRNAQ